MKKLMVLILLVHFTESLFGQNFINDPQGNPKFHFDTLTNSLLEYPTMTLSKKILSDGQIKDGAQMTVCYYDSNTGEFRDLNNAIIGIISANGEIKDMNGDLIGSISNSGNVYNANNSFLGSFSLVIPLELIAFHFFFYGQ